MRITQILIALFFTLGVQSQHTVSGNFSPASSFRYIMVYHLATNGIQYVTDTGIKNGQFSFMLPNSVSPGIYRLVYAVPQDKYFIDIIYNCEEDIVLNFDLDSGLKIVSSEENTLYNDYFSEIDQAKDKLMDFYSDNKSDEQEYMNLVNSLREIQEEYETKSDKTIANHFIRANRYYLPEKHLPLKVYLSEKKQHYFDHIDFRSPTLQTSEFFNEKILNYMFWAVPPGITEKKELVKEMNKNVDFIATKLEVVPEVLKTNLWTQAWQKANENEVYEVSDYIFDTYLKKLALEAGNENLIANIETQTRLRIGAVSPEIKWQENGANQTLSKLNDASKYIVIFWSSSCPHCLNELPGLHEELKKIKDVSVVAVGLEDNALNWRKTIPTLPDFHHAIALGKWDSEYVKTFAIQQTPTYFILDKDKRFLDRPQDADATLKFLKDKS